jgi:hypothetical protein
MRAIKGLLLASAAGLAAVSSASAADLPVKAKPVEYVKVCSLYGAGFFYVPGTETCLKIGMFIRADTVYGAGNVGSYYIGAGPVPATGSGAHFTRTGTDYYTQRARINLTTDWRTQTDYGVLRAYAAIIAQNSSGQITGDAVATGVAGILRAFIQFAGFTVGHAVSYFDFFNGADYGYLPSVWGGSTGVNGTNLLAYTWQLGNGWSASIDVEDSAQRARRVVNSSAAISTATGVAVGNTLGGWAPDLAGNVRVDQAWGSFQVMAALHNASGGYYGGVGAFCVAGTTNCGHPGEKWGWAIGAGLRLTNFLQPKNTFEVQVDYAKGANGYIYSVGLYGNPVHYGSGNTISIGNSADGVFTSGNSVELTESWGFMAAYQHYWNSQWRTSVVGGYSEINYGGTATAYLCGTGANSATVPVQNPLITATVSGVCNPDFSMHAVSTRTAWNPHPTLEIGLDLIWYHIDSASVGSVLTLAANGARPAGNYTVQDSDRYLTVLRFQKTVLP